MSGAGAGAGFGSSCWALVGFSETWWVLLVVVVVLPRGAYGGGGGIEAAGAGAAPVVMAAAAEVLRLPFKTPVANSYEGGSRRPEGRGFEGEVAIWQYGQYSAKRGLVCYGVLKMLASPAAVPVRA